jgi:hypothetical protein
MTQPTATITKELILYRGLKKTKDQECYDTRLLLILGQRFNEGFKATRICKPTSDGTKITFKCIEDEADEAAVIEDLKKRNEEIKRKYGGEDVISFSEVNAGDQQSK